jgi:hypothetical protein
MISIEYANEIMHRASELPSGDVLVEVAHFYVFKRMAKHSHLLLQYQRKRANCYVRAIIDSLLREQEEGWNNER